MNVRRMDASPVLPHQPDGILDFESEHRAYTQNVAVLAQNWTSILSTTTDQRLRLSILIDGSQTVNRLYWFDNVNALSENVTLKHTEIGTIISIHLQQYSQLYRHIQNRAELIALAKIIRSRWPIVWQSIHCMRTALIRVHGQQTCSTAWQHNILFELAEAVLRTICIYTNNYFWILTRTWFWSRFSWASSGLHKTRKVTGRPRWYENKLILKI